MRYLGKLSFCTLFRNKHTLKIFYLEKIRMKNNVSSSSNRNQEKKVYTKSTFFASLQQQTRLLAQSRIQQSVYCTCQQYFSQSCFVYIAYIGCHCNCTSSIDVVVVFVVIVVVVVVFSFRSNVAVLCSFTSSWPTPSTPIPRSQCGD